MRSRRCATRRQIALQQKVCLITSSASTTRLCCISIPRRLGGRCIDNRVGATVVDRSFLHFRTSLGGRASRLRNVASHSPFTRDQRSTGPYFGSSQIEADGRQCRGAVNCVRSPHSRVPESPLGLACSAGGERYAIQSRGWAMADLHTPRPDGTDHRGERADQLAERERGSISSLRYSPQSRAAEENLAKAYSMAPRWHTRSSTGGPGELRFDHFKVPIEVIFGELAGRGWSKQPIRPSSLRGHIRVAHPSQRDLPLYRRIPASR
jgi:hypothetical protein